MRRHNTLERPLTLPAADARNTGPVIDWLSVTLPGSRLDLAADLAGGLEPRETGYLSYRNSALGDRGGLVAWNEKARSIGGVHLVLSSKALHALGVDGRAASARSLLSELTAAGGKATRLDLALDDYTGAVSTSLVYRAICRGHVTTRFGSYSRIVSGRFRPGRGILPGARGDTVYIGSRASESFLRCYDKAAEAGVVGEPWTRTEVEWKGKRASEIARRVGQGENPVAYVRGLIEFKDYASARSITRMKRAEPARWWLDLLGTNEKKRLSLPKDARSLESVTRWLERQVSGALTLLTETMGRDAVLHLAAEGMPAFSRNRDYQEIAANYAAGGPGITRKTALTLAENAT